MAKNAARESIKERLIESLKYYDSHNKPFQPIFDSLVDETFARIEDVIDPDARAKEMKYLYPILFQTETSSMIPSIRITEDEYRNLTKEQYARLWLKRWIEKYAKSWRDLPSQRAAKPKSAVTDEALIRIVFKASNARDENEAKQWATHHNLFMSAENIGGNLLEEYIASKIIPYGWIWCRGEIITAIDFCNYSCTRMFQVKNKSNTENSSSSAYREQAGAKLWYRMDATKHDGRINTHWPELVAIVKDGTAENEKAAAKGDLILNSSSKPCNDIPEDLLSEDGYLDFISLIAEKNQRIITGLEA